MILYSLGRNGGRIIIGVTLLLVGGYYFLRNTLGLDLGDLDEDAIWPVIVLALGAWIVFRGLTPHIDPRVNDEPRADVPR